MKLMLVGDLRELKELFQDEFVMGMKLPLGYDKLLVYYLSNAMRRTFGFVNSNRDFYNNLAFCKDFFDKHPMKNSQWEHLFDKQFFDLLRGLLSYAKVDIYDVDIKVTNNALILTIDMVSYGRVIECNQH